MSEILELKELPEGWVWTTLGDIFKWGSGGTPKRTNSAYYGGEIPWLIIRDLNDGAIGDSETKINENGLKNSSAKWVEVGSVLVAMYGSIGKLGIATERLTTNQAIAFTHPGSNNGKYLFYYLMHSRSKLASKGKGIAQKNISQTVLKAFPFPLAPPEQQKQIVAKIEQLFSHIDSGIESLNTAKQCLKQYRQSVLKAAVTGELTKEWREANESKLEPASQLLERILQTRRQKWEEQQLEQFKAKGKLPKNDKWKNRYKEPVLVELPKVDLPIGWSLCTFDQIIIELKNGVSIKPTETSGVAIFRISAVRAMSVNKEDVRYLEEDFDCKDFEIKNGDLLFTRYNGNPELVGVCGKVKGLQQKTVYPDKLMRARLVDNDLVSSDYLELSLNCGVSKSFIRDSTKTTAGQSGIAGSDVKKCPVILPCYKEQVKIAEIVDEKLTSIRYLEKNIGFQLLKAEKNKQSILAFAFRGDL